MSWLDKKYISLAEHVYRAIETNGSNSEEYHDLVKLYGKAKVAALYAEGFEKITGKKKEVDVKALQAGEKE